MMSKIKHAYKLVEQLWKKTDTFGWATGVYKEEQL